MKTHIRHTERRRRHAVVASSVLAFAATAGAAGGIGKAIAQRLASEGAAVLMSDVNDDAGRKVGHPQMVLRVGYAKPGPESPRRPLDQIVEN